MIKAEVNNFIYLFLLPLFSHPYWKKTLLKFVLNFRFFLFSTSKKSVTKFLTIGRRWLGCKWRKFYGKFLVRGVRFEWDLWWAEKYNGWWVKLLICVPFLLDLILCFFFWGFSFTAESEDNVDSFNSVTCYCGKPFAGRPMIECSGCLTWWVIEWCDGKFSDFLVFVVVFLEVS